MEEVLAKRIVENMSFAYSYSVGHNGMYRCPRCGHFQLYDTAERNAVSRKADAYVCSECGTEEALNAAFGNDSDDKVSSWQIIKSLEEILEGES